MRKVIERARAAGVERIAFGDLFLEDIRRYREQQLSDTGISPLFPLWHRPTAELAKEMLDAGVRAHLTSVDPKQVPGRLAGRLWDRRLIEDLPTTADPCGENGEFHTFVSAGPMLGRPLPVKSGPVVERDGFVFADLVLESATD